MTGTFGRRGLRRWVGVVSLAVRTRGGRPGQKNARAVDGAEIEVNAVVEAEGPGFSAAGLLESREYRLALDLW